MAQSIQWRNDGERYGVLSILLHWCGALAVLTMLATAAWVWVAPNEDAADPRLRIHVAIGALVLPLLALRIVWHALERRPVSIDPGRLGRIARLVHVVMLVLVAMQLVTGPFDIWSGGWSIGVFNWFELPSPVGETMKPLHDRIGDVHRYTGYVIAAFVTLHVAAALKHLVLDRDRTVPRMLGLDRAENAAPPTA